ncbi:MAG: molecular chaperone DnaJ [Opitutaceae bacterium]|nr:molecular chaperone DnaJ [Opitutaceae bacterium]
MSATPRKSDTFRDMVARQPDNELFRFSLAQALTAECRYLDAVEHFRFCVKKKPDWMVARIQLGKLYLELGKKPEAILQLQEALKLAVDQHHEDPERELRTLLDELRAS